MTDLTSAMKGFRGVAPSQPYQYIYNPQCAQPEPKARVISYLPKVCENVERERLTDLAYQNALRTPEKKPDHFFTRQDKITRFIPPTYNDTLVLDVDEVKINKSWSDGKAPYQNFEYAILKDKHFVDGRPSGYSVNPQKPLRSDIRPEAMLSRAKLQIPEISTRKNAILRNQENRNVSMIKKFREEGRITPQALITTGFTQPRVQVSLGKKLTDFSSVPRIRGGFEGFLPNTC